VAWRGTTFPAFTFTPRRIFIVVLSDISVVSLNNEIFINEFLILYIKKWLEEYFFQEMTIVGTWCTSRLPEEQR
jgi:uncharacterized membrane protein (DUF441 family)